jgi:hypothetical protein
MSNITFLVPMHYENNNLDMFIGMMLSQTNPNWIIWILHNGINIVAENRAKKYNDKRIKFFQNENSNFWGCYNRQNYLKNVETEYVINSSIHDYYIPIAIQEILSRENDDFIYWQSINHLVGYHTTLDCEPIPGQIDWGNFAVKTDIAKQVGINHPEDFMADGLFVKDLMNSGLISSKSKINNILTIHN